jgi:hypothetical protein
VLSIETRKFEDLVSGAFRSLRDICYTCCRCRGVVVTSSRISSLGGFSVLGDVF